MDRGDVNNSCIFRMHEHYGTHMDAPRHFHATGLTISELPFDRFFYEAPLLLEIPKGSCEYLEPEDFAPYEDAIDRADFLMIRTGFERYRATEPEKYQMESPAISARGCEYLVKTFGGRLKTVCFDAQSLGNASDTSGDGVEAHRWLLGAYTDEYICMIEDAHLAGIPAGATLLAAASIPLRTRGTDSGPVTAWVEL
jgi:kynurenine formamidase